MQKSGKIVIYILIGIFVIVGALLGFVKTALPNVGDAPSLKITATPQRLERGKYLANHITVCIDCHSSRQWDTFAAPLDTTTIGAGGEKFDQSMGFPGTFYAPNITPQHLGSWTDGELLRAITTGVSKDGHALFPVMPYLGFGRMDQEDVYSIIAYIRSLPAKNNEPGTSNPDFPMNFIINTIPAKASFAKMPPKTDTVQYGGYLVNAAGCGECHTKQEKGQKIKGMEFAGGFEFNLPGGAIYSANITPDVKTGIGSWTREQFVSRFKMYTDSAYHARKINPGDFQTIMPWVMYSGMDAADLESIYAYLKTLKPINNTVTRFKPVNKGR
ncbi:c-type cytochrome [Hufsiella ginkgonis]|uniref:C-type cytochrome n=1 Tax=Hufsiella ginkgonis TaxID=2695274 RepID=A0A7K1XXJ3_9SPHI|nr:c-type cytochrome [Hufsiella ginkgonis]MXV15557.1 c-type cytochrome [Hufsiella ginkgonis]